MNENYPAVEDINNHFVEIYFFSIYLKCVLSFALLWKTELSLQD